METVGGNQKEKKKKKKKKSPQCERCGCVWAKVQNKRTKQHHMPAADLADLAFSCGARFAFIGAS
jgi:ribosomal protein L34E